jgi:hypothetical protein
MYSKNLLLKGKEKLFWNWAEKNKQKLQWIVAETCGPVRMG